MRKTQSRLLFAVSALFRHSKQEEICVRIIFLQSLYNIFYIFRCIVRVIKCDDIRLPHIVLLPYTKRFALRFIEIFCRRIRLHVSIRLIFQHRSKIFRCTIDNLASDYADIAENRCQTFVERCICKRRFVRIAQLG